MDAMTVQRERKLLCDYIATKRKLEENESPETDEYRRIKAPKVRLYAERQSQRLDLDSGKPLTFEDVKFPAQCYHCGEWFWSDDEDANFQVCSDLCHEIASRQKGSGESLETFKRKRQIINALGRLDEPSSSMMLCQQIMADTGESWPMHRSQIRVSHSLNRLLTVMVNDEIISKSGRTHIKYRTVTR